MTPPESPADAPVAEPSADARAQDRQKAPTLVQYAYEAIRRDILSGALAPGLKLRVETLKKRLDVGSSTLREALSLLTADALVTSEGQRGFRVAPISVEDIRDIGEVRKMLESRALRESIRFGDDEWEAGVVAAYHRLSRIEERIDEDRRGLSGEWEERNAAFHEALIAACPSRWLRQFRALLYQQSERYRRLSLVDGTVPRNVHQEHEAIMKAALARDADLACELIERHIDCTTDLLTTVFARRAPGKPSSRQPG